ncbi:MAG: hypothetical protein WDZ49_06350, partial [Litorilinea sp.]
MRSNRQYHNHLHNNNPSRNYRRPGKMWSGWQARLGLLALIIALAPLLTLGALPTPVAAHPAEQIAGTGQSNTLFAPGLSAGDTTQTPEDPDDPDDPDDPEDPEDPEGPGIPGEPLSPEARVAAVAAMTDALNDVRPPADTPVIDRDLEGELYDMADALLALPQVVTTVVQTETLTVHAILSDGLPIAIINNRPPGSDDREPPATDGQALPQNVHSGATSEAGANVDVAYVPGTPRAVVANFDGGDSVRAEVGNMLSQAGYSVVGLGADIQSMRNYSNLGALYLDTHGASFLRVSGFITNTDGNRAPDITGSVYALQTSTTVAVDTLTGIYQDDLLNGRIVVAFVETDQGFQAKLAITERFIAHYWSFDDAIVMIHACFGGSAAFNPDNQCAGACTVGDPGVFDPTPLRVAMIQKGAKAVISFDNYTNASYAREGILYFFNRMLGLNENQPLNPPARPFPVQEVQTAMAQAGLLRFTKPSYTLGPFGFGGNDVNFTFTVTEQDGAGMAPSIEYVDIVDDADRGQGEFTLHGNFGEKQGTVELAGTPLSVSSWSRTQIVADAPFDLSGDLVVKAPGNVESNRVPITLWTGQLSYTLASEGSLEAQTTLQLRFRADIHRARATLADAPEYRSVEAYIAPPSTGNTRGSGSYTDGDTTIQWAGNRTMEVLGQAAVDGYADIVFPGQAGATATAGGLSLAQGEIPPDEFGGVVQLDP